MYHSFLIFGTVWFWLMIGAVWIIITAILETHTELSKHHDEGGGSWATVVMVIALAAYFLVGSDEHLKTAFNFLVDNPVLTIGAVAAYFLTGVLWAFAKWYFFLSRIREDFDESLKLQISSKIKNFEIPQARDYKNRIVTWISYWPISLSWTVLDDPLKKIAHNIYLKCGKIFDSISFNKFKDVEELKKEYLEKQAAEDLAAAERLKKKAGKNNDHQTPQ
jgi:hypothetical protein